MLERIPIDLLINGIIALPFFIYGWWRNRILKQKVGTLQIEFIREKLKKWYRYRFLVMILAVVTGSLVYFAVSDFIDSESRTSPFGFLPVVWAMNYFMILYTIRIGENGLAMNNKFYPWKKIDYVEWDRDVKQQLWAFKVFLKNSKTPLKGEIEREFQPKADELFKKFLKTKKEPEAIPA